MRVADVLVVGAGPAGVSAASQAKHLGLDARIIDRSGRAGGLVANGFLVENYPGLEAPISGAALARRLAEHLGRFGLEVERAEAHDFLNDGGVWITSTSAGEIASRAVVFAVGTRPRPLGVPGESACGGRLFHDVRELLARIPSPRTVAIAGGGEAACDTARSLAAAGAEVELLARGTALKAHGRLVEAVRTTPGVAIRFGSRIGRLAAKGDRVVAEIESDDGLFALEVDAVLVAVGREPALSPIFPDCGHGRPVGRQIQVSDGVFVCGDARLGGLGQVGIAVGDGLEAAGLIARALRVSPP
jgi:thioredoxin reductase (NADPH)